MSKQIPGATIQGTYSTYLNSQQRSFNRRLGNVVDFFLERLLWIELGAWYSGIRLTVMKEGKVSVETLPDGRTRILISRK